MSLTCRFIMPNEDFSEEFANENHGGEESEDNYRILWEDEFNFTGNIKEVKLTEEKTFNLRGEKQGKEFEIQVPNMKVWTIEGDNLNQIAISENSIEKENIDLEKSLFEIQFKEKSVLTNIIPGVYIDIQDFPKELIQ